MSRSSRNLCITELTPLCTLPCSVRFTLWCLRLAKLGVQGVEPARERLREVHAVLQQASAAAALERWVGLLLQAAARPLDIREFGSGSTYSSGVELNLLVALGWLQAGESTRAQRMLAAYAAGAELPAVVEAAARWTAHLKEAGILLPYLEEAGGVSRYNWACAQASSSDSLGPCLH